MAKIGDRVGAVLSADDETVNFLGFGVYEGNFIPCEDVGGMGDLLRDVGVKNPRILLDSGSTVYGCECWWGPEEAVKKKFIEDGRKIKNISIEDARKQEKNDK